MADNTPLQSFHPFNHLDDSSFNLAVYEFSHGPLSYDADRLETLLFNLVERPQLLTPFLVIWIPTLTLSLAFWRQNKLFYYTFKHSKLNEKFRPT